VKRLDLQAIILDKQVLDWLLAGPVWLRYAVELQLLDKSPDAGPVMKDDSIVRIRNRLKDSSTGIPALKSGRVHYTETGKAYWDLFFLADIGLTVADLGLEKEAEEIFRFQERDGAFVIPPNVQDNYYCMSAILVASLARMGYRDDPRVRAYIGNAMSTQMPGGGWDCYGDFGLYGGDSCPMDNLNILMLLGQYEEYRDEPRLNGAIDLLLRHWEERTHLYGFGIGRRFKSLQYPAVKYGILRVIDVLSMFSYAIDSRSFQSMLDFVHGKAVNGKYHAEAVDAAFAGFDFGQTAEPSRWLTFIINRVDKRVSQYG
jgi:hypothetical protein